MPKSAVTRLQPPRGTHDLIGEQQRRHHFVTDTARAIAGRYGFEEWATPIFEDTAVFARTLGETSDVVTKEMYSFADRGGDSLTLRPEGTAGVCRALVSNGLTQTLPQRVFYAGPMFRYERPQKGRFRQFHQIGVELIGPSNPVVDAEVIACGYHILRALGIADEVRLEINTLGDDESRARYREALVAYFSEFAADLSAESRVRLEKNPLRILDSKDATDRAIIADAPRLTDHLKPGDHAYDFHDSVKRALKRAGIPFVENPRIVRGLDYYSYTAFEFVTERLGAQGTVMAGGHYETLVREMGGPEIPGVGFAAGVERLEMLLAAPPLAPAPVFVLHADGKSALDAFNVAQGLREAGIAAEFYYYPDLGGGLRRANKVGARAAVILGEDELARGVAQVKDLASGAQSEVRLDALVASLAEAR